jgi:hypothetical protein
MNFIETILALLAFFGQIGVLLLVAKMISFATKYGKPWANAFKIFFICMSICLLRRMAVLGLTLGINGEFKEAVLWYDRYVSNDVLTGLYLLFLIMLVRWWKDFFENLADMINRENNVKSREDTVGKREIAIQKREDNCK